MNKTSFNTKKISATLIGLFSCVFLWSGCDIGSAPEDELFVKFYGSSRTEEAVDLLVKDDQIILIGNSNSPSILKNSGTASASEVDYYIVYTDLSGNMQSSIAVDNRMDGRGKTLADDLATRDIPNSGIATSDGGLLVVGTTYYAVDGNEQHSDIFVAKLTSSGALAYTRTIGEYPPVSAADPLPYTESGAHALEVEDGYIIIGTTNHVDKLKDKFNTETDLEDMVLFKVDKSPEMNIIWRQVHGYAKLDQGRSILRSPRGEVFIMGRSEQTADPDAGGGDANGGNVYFARINSEGRISGHARLVGDNADEQPRRMHVGPGDVFLIVGTRLSAGSQSAFVYELSDAGSPLLHPGNMQAGTASLNAQGYDVMSLSGAGYWVAGRLTSFSDDRGARKSEMLLMRMDAGGRLDPAYGTLKGGVNYGGVEDDAFHRITQLPSRHLLLLGSLGFEGGSTMMCLMKVSPTGKLIVE